MSKEDSLNVLWDVVCKIRLAHINCVVGACPWPSMHEYDAKELFDTLTQAGVVLVLTDTPLDELS